MSLHPRPLARNVSPPPLFASLVSDICKLQQLTGNDGGGMTPDQQLDAMQQLLRAFVTNHQELAGRPPEILGILGCRQQLCENLR